ncbi:hypothetical protein QBC47DRAFT_380144 [Echria macrotheca]|uniref:Uncharacterized protein n=1 Tax=Echria macrotheca TaxID=438768 RepID=A0AAJ0FAQ6_9PEZI|nr:hypothetical protein QBC47DRAFT_380144 [Echria macrotheca]
MGSSLLYNPNLANGTCYYTENTAAKGNFLPCGNSAIKTWPCCMAGSFCLGIGDSNACYDASYGNTYVAGCTDPSFTSPECLHKPPAFHDMEWVPMNHACANLNTASNTSSDSDITNWTGCTADQQKEAATALVKLPMASCTPYCASAYILYAGSSSLEAYASLPTLSGSSIFWQNNFVPPTAPAAGYTPGTPAGVVPTQTGTAAGTAAPSSKSEELSAGTKAGIGAGAAVGGLLLLFVVGSLVIYFVKRRREAALADGRRRDPKGRGDSAPLVHLSPDQAYYPQMTPYAPYAPSQGYHLGMSPPSTSYSGASTYLPVRSTSPESAGAYLGYKSELPAREPPGGYDRDTALELDGNRRDEQERKQ